MGGRLRGPMELVRCRGFYDGPPGAAAGAVICDGVGADESAISFSDSSVEHNGTFFGTLVKVNNVYSGSTSPRFRCFPEDPRLDSNLMRKDLHHRLDSILNGISTLLFGSPAWIRTTIHGSKGRCPTIRRPGKNDAGPFSSV